MTVASPHVLSAPEFAKLAATMTHFEKSGMPECEIRSAYRHGYILSLVRDGKLLPDQARKYIRDNKKPHQKGEIELIFGRGREFHENIDQIQHYLSSNPFPTLIEYKHDPSSIDGFCPEVDEPPSERDKVVIDGHFEALVEAGIERGWISIEDGERLSPKLISTHPQWYTWEKYWAWSKERSLNAVKISNAKRWHEEAIFYALIKGKFIPDNVLAEYPNLDIVRDTFGGHKPDARSLGNRKAVETALSLGYSVPMEILLQHPDLLLQYGTETGAETE